MWAVVDVDGKVTFHESTASSEAVRRVFGGYRPVRIEVDETVGAEVSVSANAADLQANFPMTALLAGHTTGWIPMKGPVVVVGSDGTLPTDLYEKLKALAERYVPRAVA